MNKYILLGMVVVATNVYAVTGNDMEKQTQYGCAVPSDPACRILFQRDVEIDYVALDKGITYLNAGIQEAKTAKQSTQQRDTNSFTLGE